MIRITARAPLALALAAALLCLQPISATAKAQPYFGFALDGYPIGPDRLASLGNQTGIPPSIVTFFLQWPQNAAEGRFPTETLAVIRDFGATPCLTWEPMYIKDGQEVAIAAEDIVSGKYDPYIDRFARGSKEFGIPLIIRFAHEMNLERYHWGGAKSRYGPKSPQIYKQMFRHVVERFRAQGATNALFAFCPNAESMPHPQRDNAAWNIAEAYYPGADAVDLVGMDGYNWGTTQTRDKNGWDSSFRSFADIFAPIRDELAAMAPGKPLMVFETASAAQGGDKASWILAALDTAASWNLAAVIWFQADKEVDWRIESGTGRGLVARIREKTRPGRLDIPPLARPRSLP